MLKRLLPTKVGSRCKKSHSASSHLIECSNNSWDATKCLHFLLWVLLVLVTFVSIVCSVITLQTINNIIQPNYNRVSSEKTKLIKITKKNSSTGHPVKQIGDCGPFSYPLLFVWTKITLICHKPNVRLCKQVTKMKNKLF